MVIRSAEFLKSGLSAGHFPQTPFPEVAFAGRSNVGKSSLINVLSERKALVRTSRTPGQTRTLNFFLINRRFVLVDLPGYGYSQAPKAVIRKYQEALSTYLTTRTSLGLVVLLLDIRRLPSEADKNFYRLVRSSDRTLLIVLTKIDTIGKGNWKTAWEAISNDLGYADGQAIFFSARTGQGKKELWEAIVGTLGLGEG